MRPNRTTAFVSAAFVSTALVTLLAGCGSIGGSDRPAEEIVIGADLELTGPAAAVGVAYERALRLKVDQLNASGSLSGRRIKLVLRDNRTDPGQSAANIAELIARPELAAIVTGVCSDCLLANARSLNDKRIPAIALAPAGKVSSPVEERRYVFKLGPNPGDSAATLTGELSRSGVRRIGLLTTEDVYGSDGQQAMGRDAQKVGITITARTTVRPTDTDLSQAVQGLIAKSPDALVVWALPAQAALAAKGARDAGYKGRLYFDAAAAGELFLAGSAAAATDGAFLVFTHTMAIDDVVATTPATSARKQWFRDYTSKYGGYFGYASFAADAVQMIVNAVLKAGGIDWTKIRAILEDTQMDGLSGPIRLTPDNHSGLMPQALTMLVARSGRWRLIA